MFLYFIYVFSAGVILNKCEVKNLIKMLCSIEHIIVNGSATKTGQSVFHECSALLNCDFESGTMLQLFSAYSSQMHNLCCISMRCMYSVASEKCSSGKSY